MIRLLLGLLALPACATMRAGDASTTLIAIVGADVIPMIAGTTLLRDQTVLVDGARIAVVGPRSTTRIPRGARTVDARGKYLLPGLADMHVHLEYIEDPRVLGLFVANGVTTIRSMDGRPFVRDWRDRVRSAALVGPRILTAGPIIDGAPPLRPDNLAVADEAGARAVVAAQAVAGYDFVKLYTNLAPAPFRAAADEARRRGLRVAAHIPRALAIDDALSLLWSVEHLSDFAASVAAVPDSVPAWARRAMAATPDRAKVADLVRRLAESRTWIVPTTIQQDRAIASAERIAAWRTEPAIRHLPEAIIGQWQGMAGRFADRLDADDWALVDRARQHRLAFVAALHRAGVRLAIGTDTPNPFVAMGASVHQELANFVEAGIAPIDALRAATVAPAMMLGLEAEAGTVAAGKRADLILLSADPLTDIRATATPFAVILAGRLLDRNELQALARALAAAPAAP